MKSYKWIAIGLGTLFGVSHIAMIGMLSNRESKLPRLDLPVGPYTSYQARVSKDEYMVNYRANDPKSMYTVEESKTKAGFLGLGNNNKKVTSEYTMEGAIHNNSNNPVSSDLNVACIEAVGSAKGTGRLVGTSVGTAAAPSLTGIPFVGWVAAGWVAMFGGEQGAEIGGNMAKDLNKNC